jgi:hypothetical protein
MEGERSFQSAEITDMRFSFAGVFYITTRFRVMDLEVYSLWLGVSIQIRRLALIINQLKKVYKRLDLKSC